MLKFGADVCNDLDAALDREWLETNGIGGFASSTIVGLNTRRYHGLLVAATKPPLGRLLLVSWLEETLHLDDEVYELSACQYPGVVHPQGHLLMSEFRLDPFPIFVYRLGSAELEKSVCMLHGSNTTVVRYTLRAPADVRCRLEVRPLLAFRDYHALVRENGDASAALTIADGLVSCAPYQDLPTVHFAHDADGRDERVWWYRNAEYRVERERGFDFHEDLFSPFALSFDLGSRATATIIASTEVHDAARADEYCERETARRSAIAAASPSGHPLVRALTVAADQFVVSRDAGRSVIAGYHWFGDWGRDTMISLPGLAVVTGRYDVARDVLRAFAPYVDRGMLPNRFPDHGDAPEYNTVDSTLWYFEAARSLAEASGDYDFVREELYATLADIVSWHIRGTRYNIRVDSDSLLLSGEEGVQLTWMDARVGDRVVTPRRGKPVEIQALWYNALRTMEDFAQRFGDRDGEALYGGMATRASQSFEPLFWNEEAGCLYDAVDGPDRDASIRPNQILAASLPHIMLSPSRARAVVNVVERELLTPVGLRSLAASDPRYVPRYKGDPATRDGGYHQGTVWAWLLGPFVTAYVRVHGGDDAARKRAAAFLGPMLTHLSHAGLGQISEIFDAERPHVPRGCIAQAWSVAEVLRCAIQDLTLGVDAAP